MGFYRVRGNPICEIKINDSAFEIIDNDFEPNSMKISFDKVDRIEMQEKKQSFFMIIATMMVGVFSNLGIFKINEQSKYLKNSTIFIIFFKDSRSTEIEILNAFEPAVRSAIKKLNQIFQANQNS